MKRISLVMLVVALALPMLALVGPVSAQAGVTVWDEGCVIYAQGKSLTGGTYLLEVWDDLELIGSATVGVDAGESFLLAADLGGKAIGSLFSGIGVYVYESGALIWASDPYGFVSCDDVCEIKIPSGSVVGELLVPTNTYWGPGEEFMIQPQTVLIPSPDNKAFWVIGLDESGDWYKIMIGCQSLWVPASTMGPNYDEVWNGTPLPTRVVS